MLGRRDDQPMIDLSERIVEELIYERVRVGAELLELGELERDLGASLRRAIADLPDSPSGCGEVIDRCLDRVLRRVIDERRASDDG